ncbi:MAG: hypothetical protein PHD19_11555 [Dechloromonas sp.]|nr:hypothetical protein [Dechloromonas sp.]
MKFIEPVSLASAALISSTIAEADYPAWDVATSYTVGARVIKTATHRVYESVKADNLGHDPATDKTAEWWVDVGPTNRWAMFDASVGSVSSVAGALTVVLEPGIISALALLDIAGTAVHVVMESGGATVYDKTFDIADDAELLDWWMYFFGPITPATTLIVTDLPPFHAGRLTVSITPAGGSAACGTLAVGELVEVGDVEWGARIGVTDYSRKETDEWGVTSVTERGYAKRLEPSVEIRKTAVDYVARRFAAIRARPVVWIGVPDYESTVIYGWLRDWGIAISYPTFSVAQLTIEGLT